jgi:hypothetical protein
MSEKNTQPTAEHQADVTADEMFDALTGFEEIAIAKSFGKNVETLAKSDQLQLGRALIFAHLRRGGAKDVEAYKQAQGMSTRQARDYFQPGEPVTESGKGNSPRE